MKAGDINDNICRLLQFLCVDSTEWNFYVVGAKKANYSAEDLLNSYRRVMNVHGCPKNGLSRLYLYQDAYLETKDWIEKTKVPTLYHHLAKKETIDNGGQVLKIKHPADVGCLYGGYEWHIQQIETD